MLTTNFNLAMVRFAWDAWREGRQADRVTLKLDLASGQDGMGAGLGLDMQMDPISAGGEGEFHGLGLRCVLPLLLLLLPVSV